ncbi:FAD-binding oxidoreductase [Pseudomonas guariconensis]|uniref:FAD-binding oxidoreductase n=1 Tax=Pseudomonas TaxID=286 RepID=UPI0020971A3A|nr:MULTISPECIES: FAD-binding oxidoreductase [Pseudomonas]MCO7636366.1 FAD-binding oxidoreductase [Pseudomonas sp. S 311-6]MCO7516050.1 FAD-binding oxidoreductase [Pseudomonas putida]MCO7563791.1 FAD-binding oxidoreductase [Pseudomonas mosselii]MCO7606756.1 FAD-binding oxidoreductase [Pseudomonas guariconensis]MCO7617973.1 FAD-binding oxidoreductase [Pseudomonas guariconensis]
MLDAIPAAKGFARFQVTGKVRESATITSLLLKPAMNDGRIAFRPGQFIVVRIPQAQGPQLLRAYSLSSDPDTPEQLRISVKHERAPAHLPDVPAGVGSSFLHEALEVGGQLEVAGPSGNFVLDEQSTRPVLLFSGGVGLTPMVSMLHRLATHSARPVYFVHACENGSVHALREEVLALAAKRAGIRVHFCYRTPSDADVRNGHHHSSGLVSRETLQALLPLDDYDVYLCGPRPFMQANWRLLRGLGIERERIRYEFFGPATVLDEDEAPAVASVATPSAQAQGELTVRFEPSGRSVTWEASCPSLLDCAEQAGLSPPFSCRAGLCSACMTPLLSGTVEYLEAPLAEPEAGQVLLCCARPTSPVVLALGRR